jgi:hypothetical protein
MVDRDVQQLLIGAFAIVIFAVVLVWLQSSSRINPRRRYSA